MVIDIIYYVSTESHLQYRYLWLILILSSVNGHSSRSFGPAPWPNFGETFASIIIHIYIYHYTYIYIYIIIHIYIYIIIHIYICILLYYTYIYIIILYIYIYTYISLYIYIYFIILYIYRLYGIYICFYTKPTNVDYNKIIWLTFNQHCSPGRRKPARLWTRFRSSQRSWDPKSHGDDSGNLKGPEDMEMGCSSMIIYIIVIVTTIVTIPKSSMYGMFTNICPKNHPVLQVNIPAPWSIWDIFR